MITRQQIRQSSVNTIYIYGESMLQGSDWVDDCNICRGEPNCYGITTCRCFSLVEKDRVFKPNEIEGIQWRIQTEIISIPLPLPYAYDSIGHPIMQTIKAMPLLGKGASLMERDTPSLYLFMVHELEKRFPKIEGL